MRRAPDALALSTAIYDRTRDIAGHHRHIRAVLRARWRTLTSSDLDILHEFRKLRLNGDLVKGPKVPEESGDLAFGYLPEQGLT